jgi:hypothetical protein
VKPIHDPTTTRYPSAIHDAREIDPVWMSPNSPAKPPTARKIPAATSISIPAATSGRLGSSAWRW